jgi:hypothetical protein
MLRLTTAALLAATLSTTAGCIISDGDSSFSVYNDSDYVIEVVNITEVDSPDWGPNYLDEPLFPGDEVVIVDIECDVYDVRVIDEDGFACALYDLDLCFDDDTWVVDNQTLDFCE